uniref:Uncharacterized protein n=1 Tax=Arundo donax TaxID=35708 RepID=A0A0A8Y184_ARUDO
MSNSNSWYLKVTLQKKKNILSIDEKINILCTPEIDNDDASSMLGSNTKHSVTHAHTRVNKNNFNMIN